MASKKRDERDACWEFRTVPCYHLDDTLRPLSIADHISVLRGACYCMTQVIKMLVVVVTLFAICWLPLHAFILLIDFRPDLTEYETVSQKHFFVIVYSAVHWLAMSNSCVNPIIYGFLHDSFRVRYIADHCCFQIIHLFQLSNRLLSSQLQTLGLITGSE